MNGLEVEIVGLRLRNPTILASGIFDETGRSMLEVAKAGAGAIVTKSVSMQERQGYPNPCVAEVECGLLNAMGLPNPGIAAYADEIAMGRQGGVPVIGSAVGSNEDEIAEVAASLCSAGVDAVELNLSCPHADGHGMEMGSTPEIVRNVCDIVSARIDKPVLAKLTPNTTSIASLAEAAEEGGADGVVAINTLKGMTICPELRAPVLSNRVGGLSGPAIRSVGVRSVFEIFEAVEIPIIGVGGVSTARDALEYFMAGARAVQIGTAVRSQGTAVFSEVCWGLTKFMSDNGYESISDIVGVAHDDRA
ncbi:MAG: dihydroorotate dehydrogenase [Methanobacteriota archaeon]|nr:MAG: dihydroorotate dehydrogenase [Euryarchaeota archaeon]